MATEYLVNESISAKEVRLIGDVNVIMSTREALQQARFKGLDLVIISDAVPPIAKILDFSKFKYEQTRREKEMARKARASQVDLKEIQLRPMTDVRDVTIKAKKAQIFLKDGDKVKVIVKFKGREVHHAEMGKVILESFLQNLSDHKIEKPISLNGRDMMMIVAPIKVTETK